MVDVELSDSSLRAVDRAGRSLSIDVVGWDDSADPKPVPIEGMDAVVAGRATALSFGDHLVEVGDGDAENFEKFAEEKGERSIPDGSHFLKIQHQLIAYIAFDASATLERSADGSVRLAFEHPTPVTVSYWSLVDYPEATVTVEPTASGLATALTALSSAHIVNGPERTLPGWRDYPPLVEFGAETDVPDAVADAIPDTGIELAIPDEFAYGVAATSLAYHLAADVVVENRDAPVLRAPAANVHHEFSPLPAFQLEANAVFERVFYTDCLVNSETGVGNLDLAEAAFLDELDLNATALSDGSPADRLAAYLDAPYETVSDRLPRRTHVAFVRPDREFARALPHLCHYQARVYLDSGFDAVRGGEATRTVEGLANDDPMATSAWLADGVEPGTYAASPTAYENSLSSLEDGGTDDTIDVLVVANDRPETGDVVESLYADSRQLLDVSVRRRNHLTTGELVDAFASTDGLVHVVGTRVDGAIDCADGALAPEDVPDVGARVVVLDLHGEDGPVSNATGAATGRALVDAGAVAGVVRTGSLDPAPGTAFVRLLAEGFGLELSRRLVDRYVDGTLEGIVFGDGTHTLQADDSLNSIPLHVTPNGDTTFTVTGHTGGPTAGLFWHPDVPGVSSRLLSNGLAFELSSTETARLLDDEDYLVIYEDELHWSRELTPFYPLA